MGPFPSATTSAGRPAAHELRRVGASLTLSRRPEVESGDRCWWHAAAERGTFRIARWQYISSDLDHPAVRNAGRAGEVLTRTSGRLTGGS